MDICRIFIIADLDTDVFMAEKYYGITSQSNEEHLKGRILSNKISVNQGLLLHHS